MSYKDQFEHLFECILPPISEKIVWKSHPNLPIEACNMGVLRVLNEDKHYDDMLNRQLDLYSVKRMKLIYECFSNEILPAYCRVRPKNCNPYDLRIENIEVITEGRWNKIRISSVEREKNFRNQTVNEMLRKEKELSEGIDVYLRFKDLKIPDLMMKKWMAKSPWYKKHYPKKSV